jgi:hypothetical protein
MSTFIRGSRLVLAGLALAVLSCAGTALCQPPTTPASAPADPNGLRPVRPDPNAFWRVTVDPNNAHRMYATAMMDSLGMTEDEWKILEPKILKIECFRGHLANATRMPGAGRTLTPVIGDYAVPTDAVLLVAEKWQAFLKELNDKDASPDRIRLAMSDYRKGREVVQAEIDKAQAELKQLLTVRQEALLKQKGILQ